MAKSELKVAVVVALLTWLVGQAAIASQMAIVLNSSAAPPATASSVPGHPEVAGTTNIWTAAPTQWAARADGPYSIGQIFTTGSSALSVSALGTMAYTDTVPGSGCCNGNIFTPPGSGVPTTYLDAAVQVALFQVGNTTPIATANVGETGLQGGFFFQSITPVVLSANTSYVMEAYVGNGVEWFLDGSNIGQPRFSTYVPVGVNNLVTATNGVFSTTQGGVTYPTNIFTPGTDGGSGQADPFRWAPVNFLASPVPEPSSIVLCGLGAIGLLIAARGRRRPAELGIGS